MGTTSRFRLRTALRLLARKSRPEPKRHSYLNPGERASVNPPMNDSALKSAAWGVSPIESFRSTPKAAVIELTEILAWEGGELDEVDALVARAIALTELDDELQSLWLTLVPTGGPKQLTLHPVHSD